MSEIKHCNPTKQLPVNNMYFCSKIFSKIKTIANNFREANRIKAYQYYSFFTKIHLVGLGYKNFIIENNLYVLVGDANYIIFSIPNEVKVICKKNQIFLLSDHVVSLFQFANTLKSIKKLNLYKGKGLINFKNFKFTKLKVGKKQKFM